MSSQALVEQYRGRYALSPQEAAHALGLCRATIHNLINRGEIRATKIGSATRIPITEIERLAGTDRGAA